MYTSQMKVLLPEKSLLSMLEEIGVDFCIVGHSERRQYFGETDETVNKKLKKLFDRTVSVRSCA